MDRRTKALKAEIGSLRRSTHLSILLVVRCAFFQATGGDVHGGTRFQQGSKDPMDAVQDAHFPQNEILDAELAEDLAGSGQADAEIAKNLAGRQQQLNNSNKR